MSAGKEGLGNHLSLARRKLEAPAPEICLARSPSGRPRLRSSAHVRSAFSARARSKLSREGVRFGLPERIEGRCGSRRRPVRLNGGFDERGAVQSAVPAWKTGRAANVIGLAAPEVTSSLHASRQFALSTAGVAAALAHVFSLADESTDGRRLPRQGGGVIGV